MFWSVVCAVISTSVLVSGQNVYSCSDIFTYKNQGQYGAIRYQPTGQLKYVFMRVTYQIRTKLQGYTGDLKVQGSEAIALKRMLRGQPLDYRVNFPSTSFLPKVISITVNGQTVCTGPTDISGASESYTLEHLLFDKGDDDPLIVQPVHPSNTVNNNEPADNTNQDSTSFNKPSRPAQCGVISGGNDKVGLVSGGTAVTRGEWPWLVAMYLYNKLENKVRFTCGGTLVSNVHVVTAGHCVNIRGAVKNKADIILRVGAYNADYTHDPQVSVHGVRSYNAPPSYNSHTLANDLLLITMDYPVVFTNSIIPVCLWEGNTDLDYIIGKHASVIGWGLNDANEAGTGPPQKAVIPIVSTEACRASGIGFHKITSNTTLCAGFRNGTGPCNGDSGSGLFILTEDGRWRLRGVVSTSLRAVTGENKCNLQEYIVFTDVAQFMPWLWRKLQGSDTSETDAVGTPPPPPPPTPAAEEGCGVVSGGNERVDLLYRGYSVAHGDWPWLVAVYRRRDGATKFICPASLLTKEHVITVAHCQRTLTTEAAPSSLEVKAGVFTLDGFSSSELVRRVVRSDIHPEYDPSTLANNILVLTMDRPVVFSTFIRPVCLWEDDPDQNKIIGGRGTVVGWGLTETGKVGEPRAASVPIVSRSACIVSNNNFSKLTSSGTLCAGDRNGTGPCLGDSGGGLYMLSAGRWRLRGLISLSLRSTNPEEKCNLNEYTLYTDVAKYTSWIKQQIKF